VKLPTPAYKRHSFLRHGFGRTFFSVPSVYCICPTLEQAPAHSGRTSIMATVVGWSGTRSNPKKNKVSSAHKRVKWNSFKFHFGSKEGSPRNYDLISGGLPHFVSDHLFRHTPPFRVKTGSDEGAVQCQPMPSASRSQSIVHSR
jgi:hypothetical protein